ncbi:MAG: hypothetical protein Q8Q07_07565, partial [Dehalococcoidales bacterium]|nr:hypothetical protein [Dehalococcoidales bacterium]
SNGMPTYGNTSSRKLEGIPLTNIVVENPIITREEYEWIRVRMAQNKANAKRNGKHNFLLKGMIQYELDGRRYHGRHIRDNIWCYEYPDNGYNGKNHPRPYINGRRIETAVEDEVRRLLSNDAVLGSELDRGEEAVNKSRENLKKELHSLERRDNANTNAETQLLLDKNRYGSDISDEAYKRALERLQTERNHIAERKEEVTREIRKLNESSVSMMGLKQLRTNLGERIDSKEFEDRRYVLETLGTRVSVTTDAKLLVDFAIPKEISAQAIALSVPRYAFLRSETIVK